MRRAIGLALLLSACGPEEESDTDVIVDNDTYEPCVELKIHEEGPKDPVVGDQWMVSLYCDGALITGPYVVRFDPADFAMVSQTTVTFTTAGTATLKVQAGSERAEMDVTVAAQ
jgi:hypothetical protein